MHYCKPGIEFYHKCDHVCALEENHRRYCKKNSTELLPTDLPLPDWRPGNGRSRGTNGRSCKTVIPTIHYLLNSGENECDDCEGGYDDMYMNKFPLRKLPESVIQERRIFWKRIQDESNIARIVANQAIQANREARKAREKTVTIEQRKQDSFRKLATYRAKEEKKGTPYSKRLFVREWTDPKAKIPGRTKKYTDWDATGFYRRVTANDLLERGGNDTCDLCRLRLDLESARKFPCGCIFDKECSVPNFGKYWDSDEELSPECPRLKCKKGKRRHHLYPRWSVQTLTNFECATAEPTTEQSHEWLGAYITFENWLVRFNYPYDEEDPYFDDVKSESEDESNSTDDQSISDWQSDSDSADDLILREDDGRKED